MNYAIQFSSHVARLTLLRLYQKPEAGSTVDFAAGGVRQIFGSANWRLDALRVCGLWPRIPFAQKFDARPFSR